MEKIQWQVEGMDCSNCALTIRRYLEKEGMKEVKVNFATGDVSFDMNGHHATSMTLSKGIESLGYRVAGEQLHREKRKPFFSSHLHRFLFCAPFTVILLLPMIPGVSLHWLMSPWVQLSLTLPVFVVGMSFFGKSAWKSLRNGIPNMNVLIAIGAISSFVYSLYGTLSGHAANYMFYETTATILTLVFFGNYLEEASVRSTQKALNKLAATQRVIAHMIAYDDKYQEQIFDVENTSLHVGDLVLIKNGEQVPADCKILWGEADVNESLLTGESIPVHKSKKDLLIGGSALVDGTIKAQVTAAGKDTVLANILHLVKQAQGDKPPVQQLADRISAIFVPVVLAIAAVTLAANWIWLGSFTPALMRGIAVLVIACPCAMGLATPAAIAVGLGRGARNGILFRDAKSLESFSSIRQVVFDKTGTLTTGKLRIARWKLLSPSISDHEFKKIVFSLEKYSSHPLAKAVVNEWKDSSEIDWKKIDEIKGVGIDGTDRDGNCYQAGSFRIVTNLTTDQSHDIYVLKNGTLLGWLDASDEPRAEAKTVINYFHSKNIKTVILSGDRFQKTKELADILGIDTVIAEQTPVQKLERIAALNAQTPTAMVGDGINDAPALARATVGISMSDASHIAMQSAQVVLMNTGLKNLPAALGLGRQTYLTIKQNLFWAFAYNIVAIPVAALGFLSPGFGALVMGLSDVVLAINSSRLFVKRLA